MRCLVAHGAQEEVLVHVGDVQARVERNDKEQIVVHKCKRLCVCARVELEERTHDLLRQIGGNGARIGFGYEHTHRERRT